MDTARPYAQVVPAKDGAKLAVFCYGSPGGDATPLLLLHGNGGSHDSFRGLVEDLSRERLCVAPDMRAQGVSERGAAPLTYEQLAADAICVLDALGVERAFILGSSDGGIEALIMARDWPARVAGICTMGANLTPAGLADDDTDAMEAAEALYLELADQLPAAKAQAELLRLMIDEPQIDAASLAAISCPATIMAGEFDIILPEETARIAAAIPGARQVIVPNAGHSLMRDAPKAVLAEVQQLLKR